MNKAGCTCFFPDGRRYTKTKDVVFYFGLKFYGVEERPQHQLYMSKLTSEATYVPTMLAEHPNLKTYDYFSEEEKEFSVGLKYHLRDMVFYKDQSLWPYSIDVDATAIFDPVLDWIGQTVEHGWMVRAEHLHGQYVFRFSFDDLQEATLFRLRF